MDQPSPGMMDGTRYVEAIFAIWHLFIFTSLFIKVIFDILSAEAWDISRYFLTDMIVHGLTDAKPQNLPSDLGGCA
jgi:hypothetical protein